MQLLVRWLMNQHKPHTISRFCMVCLFVSEWDGMVFNYKLQNKFHLKSTWRKSLNSLIIIFAMNNCMEWMRRGISLEFVWSDRTEILDGDAECVCVETNSCLHAWLDVCPLAPESLCKFMYISGEHFYGIH